MESLQNRFLIHFKNDHFLFKHIFILTGPKLPFLLFKHTFILKVKPLRKTSFLIEFVAGINVEPLSKGKYVLWNHSVLTKYDSTGKMLRQKEVEFGSIVNMEKITLDGSSCLAVQLCAPYVCSAARYQ